MGHFEQVEDAWRLCEAAALLSRTEGRALSPAELLDRVFLPSGLVDEPRTRAAGGAEPTEVFLQTPYGLRRRAEDGLWVPFRHGSVDLSAV